MRVPAIDFDDGPAEGARGRAASGERHQLPQMPKVDNCVLVKAREREPRF